LNPKAEHKLDASILLRIKNIVQYAKAPDSEKLAESLEAFEHDVQTLLKQEWDKSKMEAETGTLQLNGIADTKH
jgi:hypothetical protein